MRPPKLLKVSHPAVILALGLLIAQIIATIQVYLSNLDLYHTLLLINSNGYLPIPNGRAMSGLQDFAPALLGGLFFAFTIGAGITLGSIVASCLFAQETGLSYFSAFLAGFTGFSQ